MAARDMTSCPVCRNMFADTDNTGVCPAGHETRAIEVADDDWPAAEVSI